MLACTASQPGTVEDLRASALARPAIGTSVIGESEVRASMGANALDVVQRQRPTFLRRRGSNGPMVVLDNMPLGGVEMLKDISAWSIAEIRYVDGVSAALMYGAKYGGGAILIRTIRAK
ncbi:MAG TPA: hypothetical protein VFT29_17300 [Gemmatimonadaceae bacterium]|nr:hypothetical protein [Gemmatimonadaceae bacterium]